MMGSKCNSHYDVFVSYRGRETRRGFAGHLHSALAQSGLTVFNDVQTYFRSKDNIGEQLMEAIENTRIAIVVFSEDYASSYWCLDEVAKIMERHKSKGLMVLPVFYHVDPSDVKYQRDRYGDALAQHEEEYGPDTVERWRIALTKAAQLPGITSGDGNDTRLVREIVNFVLSNQEPDDTPFHLPGDLVGMVSRLKAVVKLLDMDKDDFQMVALCGMGGIGKTTIAKAVFNKIAREFKYKCFLPDVRKTCLESSCGLLKLQKDLLFRMLGETIDIWDVDQGAKEIKQRCGKTKTLLVIDDVSHSRQLEKLAGASDWFGPASRIIITTRDKTLVNGHDNVKLYPVPELQGEDAEEFLITALFVGREEMKDYEKHKPEVLDYTKGLPLAIIVVAKYLREKTEDQWPSALKVLKKNHHREIFDVLRVSYDGLDERQKETLLDIACFFRGLPETYVRRVLECCEPHPDIVLGDLLSRYLISIKHNKIDMHDMIEEMGREIVRKESLYNPGKRSRLWSQEDIREVLTGNTGTGKIKGIKAEFAASKKLKLNANAFNHMKRLRVFIAHNVIPFGNSIQFPTGLRWLEWPECPSLSLPHDDDENGQIVGLCLSKSKIILSEGDLKPFCNLKFIDLSKCTSLRKIPDLSSLSHLESLDAEECRELVEVHQSLGLLKTPVRLNFLNCNKLRTFPITLNSGNLQELLLKGCLKLSKFPEILVKMEKLKELALDNTAIDELPSSIENLIGLEEFYLENCRKLKTLPSSVYRLQQLQRVSFADCSELSEFPEYRHESSGSLPALVCLDLQRCSLQNIDFLEHLGCKTTLENLYLSGSKLGTVPTCIEEFTTLRQLNLNDCEQLHEILGLPPKINHLIAKGCKSLKWHVPLPKMLKSQLEESPRCRHIDFSGCCELTQKFSTSANILSKEDLLVDSQIKILYPGSEIPRWFDHQKVDGSLSSSVDSKMGENIAGLAFCVIIGSGGRKIASLSCEIEVYKGNHMAYHTEDFFQSLEMDHMWLVYAPCTMMIWGGETRIPEGCSELKVLFKLSGGKLKCCGVHQLLKEDGSREGSNS